MTLADLERTELEAALGDLGAPRYHAGQIFRWLYRRGVTEFAAMTDLARPVRAALGETFTIRMPEIARQRRAVDGTTKFELSLEDDGRIEAVYIPDTPRQTFCVSTQVGCAMGCVFCLTARMGLARHLTAGEIAGQVWRLAHATGLTNRSFNVVLMGMGEPLHNYDATMKALRILGDPDGFAVPPRRVTLSTVGVLPALERLAEEPDMPNLAISLHATTNEDRSRLVPINRRYDLEALLDACRRFPLAKRRRITFEYVLIDGINDGADDASRLVRLLAGIKAKVNLLPLNEAAGIPFTRPSDARVNAFARLLVERGVRVSVRKSRGLDIRAACGQLIVEGTKTSAGQNLAARIQAPHA
jgi:23S rRNA (adenine2503-C2)-methyltransferase